MRSREVASIAHIKRRREKILRVPHEHPVRTHRIANKLSIAADDSTAVVQEWTLRR